jgi:uncharacterized membrane protein YgaE (UPF0421/DUF939 family)
MMRHNVSLSVGTASGTVLSVIPNIMSADILRTVILAFVGAIVSFTVSLILKKLFKPKRRS